MASVHHDVDNVHHGSTTFANYCSAHHGNSSASGNDNNCGDIDHDGSTHHDYHHDSDHDQHGPGDDNHIDAPPVPRSSGKRRS